MIQEDGIKVIFRYQSGQFRPALYVLVVAIFQLVGLHMIAPAKYDIGRHPYFYGLLLFAVVILVLANCLYRWSYTIAAGARVLVVSSFLGSKKFFYMRLRRVELGPINRRRGLYKLEVVNDQGSPVLKIVGDKLEMERVAGDLRAYVRPFG